MTRRGKIARLPRAVREELNQRIEDGEAGARLVEWLNGREEVQGVLKVYFGGRPVNEQNLSDWKTGGYVDWQQRQEAFELANGMMDEAAERKGLVTEGRLSDCVGDMAALSLARMLQAMRRMEDGPEQWETTLKIVREVVRLRKSDREYEQELRTQETFAQYPKQDELRTEEEFEDDEERLDQLIMHRLVENGRGRLEDIPAPTRSGRVRRRRAKRQETGAREPGTGDGGQGADEGARLRESDTAAPTVAQTLEPMQPAESETAASPAAQAAEAETLAEAGTPAPTDQPAQAEKPIATDKPAGAGTPGGGPEAAPSCGGHAAQGPAPQGSSRLIKANQTSRRGGRWIGPWRVAR